MAGTIIADTLEHSDSTSLATNQIPAKNAAQTFSAAQTFTAQSVHNGGIDCNGAVDIDANVDVAGSFNIDGPYKQVAETISALDVDCSTGNYFKKSISSNSTITFSNIPSSGTVCAFTLELSLTGSSTTITWPSSVYWNNDAGQTAPTLTDARKHLFTFVTSDGGTTVRGAALLNYTA